MININNFMFLFFFISTIFISNWSFKYLIQKINNARYKYKKIVMLFTFHMLYIFSGLYLTTQIIK